MAKGYQNFKVLQKAFAFFLGFLALSEGLRISAKPPPQGSTLTSTSTSTWPIKNENCTEELERKFLPKTGKCPFSGLVPVKGSCTSYIPCISFGGDLIRPTRRVECVDSVGLAFDVHDLRCRPVQDVRKCLQRLCYPEESKAKDGEFNLFQNPTPTNENQIKNETVNDYDINDPTDNFKSRRSFQSPQNSHVNLTSSSASPTSSTDYPLLSSSSSSSASSSLRFFLFEFEFEKKSFQIPKLFLHLFFFCFGAFLG